MLLVVVKAEFSSWCMLWSLPSPPFFLWGWVGGYVFVWFLLIRSVWLNRPAGGACVSALAQNCAASSHKGRVFRGHSSRQRCCPSESLQSVTLSHCVASAPLLLSFPPPFPLPPHQSSYSLWCWVVVCSSTPPPSTPPPCPSSYSL